VPYAEQPTGRKLPAEATTAGRPDSGEPVGEGGSPIVCGTTGRSSHCSLPGDPPWEGICPLRGVRH
jgi:hypothetical protein